MEQRIMTSIQECQQTKKSVNGIIEDFLGYVTACLNHKEYEEAINDLRPSDKFTQIKLRNAYDHSLIDKIGVVIMRMESESPSYSLSVCIDITEGKYNQALKATIPVSTCQSIEEMKMYVQTDDFMRLVKQIFEKQVETSFLKKELQ